MDAQEMKCKGCGGEGYDTYGCDQCNAEYCDGCGPYRDDDAPINLCEECCVTCEEQENETCRWGFEGNFWGTGCGEYYVKDYDNDGPLNKKFIFCPFCGKKIEVIE